MHVSFSIQFNPYFLILVLTRKRGVARLCVLEEEGCRYIFVNYLKACVQRCGKRHGEPTLCSVRCVPEYKLSITRKDLNLSTRKQKEIRGYQKPHPEHGPNTTTVSDRDTRDRDLTDIFAPIITVTHVLANGNPPHTHTLLNEKRRRAKYTRK